MRLTALDTDDAGRPAKRLPASPFVHQMSRSCITELAITKLVIPILFDSSPILVDSLPILFDSLVDSIQWILA